MNKKWKCSSTNGLLWAAYGVAIASLNTAHHETSWPWVAGTAAGVMLMSMGLVVWRRVTKVTGDC